MNCSLRLSTLFRYNQEIYPDDSFAFSLLTAIYIIILSYFIIFHLINHLSFFHILSYVIQRFNSIYTHKF